MGLQEWSWTLLPFCWLGHSGVRAICYYYFASAAVTVNSSHMTVSSFASWSRFSPTSNFVNGHVSTVWFMVCRRPQSQEGDWARPHLCKLARRGPWPVRKRFIGDHVWWGRWKPGCRIVGSVTIVWLTTEADDQSSLHCVIVSTDVMSDHIGRRDASRGGGCPKTSASEGMLQMLGVWLSCCMCHLWTSSTDWRWPPGLEIRGPIYKISYDLS